MDQCRSIAPPQDVCRRLRRPRTTDAWAKLKPTGRAQASTILPSARQMAADTTKVDIASPSFSKRIPQLLAVRLAASQSLDQSHGVIATFSTPSRWWPNSS